ncbi:MAG: hypothetical protein AB1486_14220 [Planctomycetota bacterium]
MVALPLVLACGFGIAGVQSRVEGLVADLGRADRVPERNAAYFELVQTLPAAAVPLLVASLPEFDLSGQGLGVSVLCAYPREVSVTALRSLSRCARPSLVLCAAVALHRFGEPSQGPTIAAALSSSGLTEAERVTMLGWLYGVEIPEVQVVLREWLTPQTELAVFDAALYHLAQTADTASSPRVAKLLDATAEDPQRTALCTAFLVVLGSREHSQQLASFLTENQSAAFFRLQRYLTLAPKLDDTVVGALALLCETTSDLAILRATAQILAWWRRLRD